MTLSIRAKKVNHASEFSKIDCSTLKRRHNTPSLVKETKMRSKTKVSEGRFSTTKFKKVNLLRANSRALVDSSIIQVLIISGSSSKANSMAMATSISRLVVARKVSGRTTNC
jgi:type IV pilus biogenesis protein CpaD/CtpE